MLALAVSLIAAYLRRRRARFPAQTVIVSPQRSTVVSGDGRVRSVQSADLTLLQATSSGCGNANLENLARTYWRFLSRVTLGLIRVVYGDDERSVVLLGRPLTLLRFGKPEYTIEDDHGKVAGGSATACWSPGRAADRASSRSTSAASRRTRLFGAGAQDRGRGGELLPVDRRRLQHAGVRGDPVGDPRAGDPRVPALAGRLELAESRIGALAQQISERLPRTRRRPRRSAVADAGQGAAWRGRGERRRGARCPSASA